MTKKIIAVAALALMVAVVAAPNASASCNPPKYISTYNGSAYCYWHTGLDTTNPAAGLVTKMWAGAVDVTGTCNFLYFGTNAGDVGLNGDFGQSCLPGAACPAGNVSVLAAVTLGGKTDFLVTQAPETPAGARNYDFSNTAHPMVPLGRPRVTSSSRAATNVNLNLAIDAISAGLYDGTASQVTGYNVLSAASASDPGRAASAYTLASAAAGGVGGAAATAVASVDCSNTALSRWVVVQAVTAAGPLPVVGEATQVNCNPSLADPKYRKLGHKPTDVQSQK